MSRLALLACLVVGTMLSAQEVKQSAANFSVVDLRGKPLQLSDYKSKVILLDFWASWCVPCRAEIPRFIEWQKKYGPDGFQVIGLSMDDDAKSARTFLKRFALNYPVAMGTEKIAESYGGVLGLPANIIIDREGHIVSKVVGETDLNQLEAEIKSQLAKKD